MVGVRAGCANVRCDQRQGREPRGGPGPPPRPLRRLEVRDHQVPRPRDGNEDGLPLVGEPEASPPRGGGRQPREHGEDGERRHIAAPAQPGGHCRGPQGVGEGRGRVVVAAGRRNHVGPAQCRAADDHGEAEQPLRRAPPPEEGDGSHIRRRGNPGIPRAEPLQREVHHRAERPPRDERGRYRGQEVEAPIAPEGKHEVQGGAAGGCDQPEDIVGDLFVAQDLRAKGDEVEGDQDGAEREEGGARFLHALPAVEQQAEPEAARRIAREHSEADGAAELLALVGDEDDGRDREHERADIQQDVGLAFGRPANDGAAHVGRRWAGLGRFRRAGLSGGPGREGSGAGSRRDGGSRASREGGR